MDIATLRALVLQSADSLMLVAARRVMLSLGMGTVRPAQRSPSRPPHVLPQLGRRGGGWVAAQVVLLAAIFLSPLVGIGWSPSVAPLFYTVGALLLLIGTAMLAAGAGALAKVSAVTPFPAPRAESNLQTSGVYRLVRHPMYGGGILIAVGWSAVFATPLGLALTALLAVFADLKARREELWLEQSFADYADYRLRTPHRLIPFIW